MLGIRSAWWILAVAAIGIAGAAAEAPVADVSLSCSKIGVYDVGGTSFGCEDSIVRVFGMWPLVCLAVLLATPPVVAAVVSRVDVSWMAVAALVGLAFVGLLNWTSFWRLLLGALPLAAMALIVALAHSVHYRNRSLEVGA